MMASEDSYMLNFHELVELCLEILQRSKQSQLPSIDDFSPTAYVILSRSRAAWFAYFDWRDLDFSLHIIARKHSSQSCLTCIKQTLMKSINKSDSGVIVMHGTSWKHIAVHGRVFSPQPWCLKTVEKYNHCEIRVLSYLPKCELK